ncbi:spore protease YyaC [Candidatus Epulonipiscium fishelsonii]|uniref:Spore protease YyaC n=1 Tax=Candidatus Epulonipiscium fishelsonii TaxID=77094 RepID=A0ACC8XC04_9FIRM|nr:spore protease YyaC [Epulopiscium sp. SCG-B05WGA-EpuloA1]ONI40020.1 spore protease YyaC [Epulopiscium sp. SCG-B11WGA-EpuloA1]
MLKNGLIKYPAYIDVYAPHNFRDFCCTLSYYLDLYLPMYQNELVLVCIGSDRLMGDSLGPLIGYKLMNIQHANLKVYGTLDNPVHAKNLKDTLDHINAEHPSALIISIDACLGNKENIGCVVIKEGSIKPGIGVDKDLPSVGHLHILGIVNLSSRVKQNNMNKVNESVSLSGLIHLDVLQKTRLSLVMKMADLISAGIRHCNWLYNYKHTLQQKQ